MSGFLTGKDYNELYVTIGAFGECASVEQNSSKLAFPKNLNKFL